MVRVQYHGYVLRQEIKMCNILFTCFYFISMGCHITMYSCYVNYSNENKL